MCWQNNEERGRFSVVHVACQRIFATAMKKTNISDGKLVFIQKKVA
jgi:hypothetical protein